MRRPSGRLIGIVALVVAWCPLAVGPAVAGSIKGAVLHAGPPPEKKTVTINIDQYVCGKSRESEDLVLGPNRGVRWAVVSLQTPPPGVRGEAPPGPVQVDLVPARHRLERDVWVAGHHRQAAARVAASDNPVVAAGRFRVAGRLANFLRRVLQKLARLQNPRPQGAASDGRVHATNVRAAHNFGCKAATSAPGAR